MADEFEDQHQGDDANSGSNDLAQLDRLIAADEAADASQKAAASEQAQRRNPNGQFKSTDQGQRAGQRQTPTEISARSSGSQKEKTEETADKAKADATQAKTTTDKQPEKKDGDTSPRPSSQSGEGEDNGKSRYEKAKEREAKAWIEINKGKDEQAARAAELDLREKALAAREQAGTLAGRPAGQQASVAEPKWQGFTAAQLAQAAIDYEAKGEFELADESRKIAGELQAQAKKAANSNGHGPGLTAGWQRLKTDIPELFNPSSPLNAEMQAILAAEPDLLADDAGPYRAAIRTGRKAIAKLEQEVAKHRTDAAQVPGLQKQVSELQARVKELEAATSITDGGGGMNRGGGGGEKPFGELTTDQMSAQLDREFATALGG